MTERILIEDVLTLKKEALRSTVVRKENVGTGFWISTVPSGVGRLLGRNSFETQVFRFLGYAERIGKTAKPDVDVKHDTKFSRWSRIDSFANDIDSAIEYHRQVAHEVADALESGELI